MIKEVYPLGDEPPLGAVPKKMHAQLIREARFGEPRSAFQEEIVNVPEIKDDEALVYVMAAGINYNNVWAALGVPLNVIAARRKHGEPEDFHIGGSDASGIVWKVGKDVKNVKVGDEVVVHCGVWDRNCPHVRAGKDPMLSPTQRIWGYETNFGSFAQFARVQGHQLLAKPKNLNWAQSAAYMLVGATAYRMLHGWPPHTVQKGDAVLIWGAAGGLGSMATQICVAAGALPVAVVSSDDKFDYCKKLGAVGVINRSRFKHWGQMPSWRDKSAYAAWLEWAKAFGEAFWLALGEKSSPRLVFEHPGENTLPTSVFLCDTGGMVVICAGTSGFNATFDLRYHWMRQKRLQGSHFANDLQAKGINDLVAQGLVNPCLTQTFPWHETGHAHQLMRDNKHGSGCLVVLVNLRANSTPR